MGLPWDEMVQPKVKCKAAGWVKSRKTQFVGTLITLGILDLESTVKLYMQASYRPLMLVSATDFSVWRTEALELFSQSLIMVRKAEGGLWALSCPDSSRGKPDAEESSYRKLLPQLRSGCCTRRVPAPELFTPSRQKAAGLRLLLGAELPARAAGALRASDPRTWYLRWFCKACSLLRARCEHGIGGMKKVLSAGFRGPAESETGQLAVKSSGEGDRERRLEAAADVCSSRPPEPQPRAEARCVRAERRALPQLPPELCQGLFALFCSVISGPCEREDLPPRFSHERLLEELCGSFVASKEACGSLVSLLQRCSGAIQGIGCSGEVPACGQAWSRAGYYLVLPEKQFETQRIKASDECNPCCRRGNSGCCRDCHRQHGLTRAAMGMLITASETEKCNLHQGLVFEFMGSYLMLCPAFILKTIPLSTVCYLVPLLHSVTSPTQAICCASNLSKRCVCVPNCWGRLVPFWHQTNRCPWKSDHWGTPTKLVSVHPTAGDVLAKSYGLQLMVHSAMTLEDWQVKHEAAGCGTDCVPVPVAFLQHANRSWKRGEACFFLTPQLLTRALPCSLRAVCVQVSYLAVFKKRKFQNGQAVGCSWRSFNFLSGGPICESNGIEK
ncbi:hypothetical protein Anapl_04974 [Anas platyrhynchos]|uniref:Uncharacterized protein n=1 Tax=Anas platyrhynchos TaxID=8839 RepID=R0KVZ4_ANAPL|nr:hypothetical protein Anapl_04974 [Anas platyrhynchos]